jgi:hypothetical protein
MIVGLKTNSEVITPPVIPRAVLSGKPEQDKTRQKKKIKHDTTARDSNAMLARCQRRNKREKNFSHRRVQPSVVQKISKREGRIEDVQRG